MTLFQTLISAILHSFSAFSGIDVLTWQEVALQTIAWDPLSPAVSALFLSSAWFALLILKRHDWISMLASLLKVILTWTRPRTVDEKMPLFIILLSVPSLVLRSFFGEEIDTWIVSPWVSAVAIVAGSIWLMLTYKLGSRYDRRQKNILALSYWDAIWIGVLALPGMFLGIGPVVGILAASLLMNYRAPAAIKITYYGVLILYFPMVLAAFNEISWQGSEPLPGLGWIQVGLGFVVAFMTGLLTQLSTEQQVEKKAVNPMAWARISLVVVFLAGYWFRNSS